MAVKRGKRGRFVSTGRKKYAKNNKVNKRKKPKHKIKPKKKLIKKPPKIHKAPIVQRLRKTYAQAVSLLNKAARIIESEFAVAERDIRKPINYWSAALEIVFDGPLPIYDDLYPMIDKLEKLFYSHGYDNDNMSIRWSLYDRGNPKAQRFFSIPVSEPLRCINEFRKDVKDYAKRYGKYYKDENGNQQERDDPSELTTFEIYLGPVKETKKLAARLAKRRASKKQIPRKSVRYRNQRLDHVRSRSVNHSKRKRRK